ncbi:ubl carboxyl-terminal hydrolase 18-like [Mustelus asterias]
MAEDWEKTIIGKSTPDEKKQVTIRSLDNLDSCDDLGAGPVDKDEGQMQPQSPWPYTSGRFKNGIVGLENKGLTCCVNAVLQSFYLTPQFTSILQRLDQKEAVIDRRNIPYVMRQLFDQMQYSVSCVQSVESFLKCLFLNHVKAYRQHDAAELFLSIFNFLMDQFQSQEMAKELKGLYEIKMEQFVSCDCGEVTVKDTSLLILPLPMQEPRHGGHFKLEDTLQDFFKPQELSRNNQWLCPFCARRMPAQQGFRLVSVPEILNLHLNRFCTSSSPYGYTKKICASLRFPEKLNLDHLPISEKTQKCGNGQECWLYQLYAVLAHKGFASFGHYTVYVKSFIDSKWYHMNDSSVHQVNWDDVKQTFGCRDSSWGETAYMLLYKRVKQEGRKVSSASRQ